MTVSHKKTVSLCSHLTACSDSGNSHVVALTHRGARGVPQERTPQDQLPHC